ncbi:MAG: hypothetical protein WA996_08400, partial [Candidatus Promineifilaceae bacterium]
PGEARIVVDSYGDILAEREVDISTGLFEAVVASLVEKDIRACKLRANEGCTGGTSESVVASGGGSVLFSASVYHCGGDSSGDLCGDIKGFAEDLRRLLPDLEQLLDQS